MPSPTEQVPHARRRRRPAKHHLLLMVLLSFCVASALLQFTTMSNGLHPDASTASTSLRLHVSLNVPSQYPVDDDQSTRTSTTTQAQPAGLSPSEKKVSNMLEPAISLALPSLAHSTLTPTPTQSNVLSWLRMEATELVHHGAAVRGANFDASVDRDRGILMSLFSKIVPLGLSLIRELRCLGNQELIQIYHCTELPTDAQLLLVQHDNRLEIIDVCVALSESNRPLSKTQTRSFRNWWIKPLAMYHTEIMQPILLDADDILLADPATVRDSDGYQENGTMFFYDRAKHCPHYLNTTSTTTRGQPYIRHILQTFNYKRFGLQKPLQLSSHLHHSLSYQGKSCHEQDSSMVAIDKRKSDKAMQVLWWLITEERFRVEYSWGDKESFWLAFELAQQPYAFSPWGVSVVESSANRDLQKHSNTLCGSIAQYYPETNISLPYDLLYVNGRALVEPLPEGLEPPSINPNTRHNVNPRHVTPRQCRIEITPKQLKGFSGGECLVGMGAMPLPSKFASVLLRRRMMFQAATLGVSSALKSCALY